MALNIKDPETERLAEEVARLAGETKTRAVKIALTERKERLSAGARRPGAAEERLRRFLSDEAWPQVPAAVLGKALTRAEREAILGYGPEGV
jgi:antitoxin VapB